MRPQPKDTDTFRYLNANPAGVRTGDCIMRSLSAATGLTWDNIIDLLTDIAHEKKLAPQDPKAEALLLARLGFVKQKQPKKLNGRKYTGREFCQVIGQVVAPGTRIVAHIGTHHVVAILPDDHGTYRICDTWDSSTRCIGAWWTLEA